MAALPHVSKFVILSSLLHSKPKSTVGTPAYIAPEVLSRREYDGKRIMSVQYKIPDYVHTSQDCSYLLSRIFVANPARRVTIKEIKSHPWFLKNLPRELAEMAQAVYCRQENPTFSLPCIEDIMNIVEEAKTPAPVSRSIGWFGWDSEEDDETKEATEAEEEDEDEYGKRVKEVLASGEFHIS